MGTLDHTVPLARIDHELDGHAPPIAGLGTASELARRAGVSDPSVVRLASKLGFDGFAHFQKRLLEEVEAGLRSPLMMMETNRPHRSPGRSLEEVYIRSAAASVETAASVTLPQVYARAARLIMEARGRVLVLGGRFTRHVAGMLAAYFKQFRKSVIDMSLLSAENFDALLDIDARDTLVVYDIRRYQTDVVRFAQQAAERGASIVLFTDPWRSPVAAHAKAVIVCPVEANSPYDSLAPAVAQTEALVARIVADHSKDRHARVRELERIRSKNAVTVEDETPSGSLRPTKARRKRR